MTLEQRVAYLEALVVNLHKLPRGLGLETTFDHPAAFSIGTMQTMGLRAEAGDGGIVDPNSPSRAVYGTCETPNGVPNIGLTGNATNGIENVGVEARFQRVADSAAFVGNEIDGAGTVLTSVRITPFGLNARSGANPLPSFQLGADGWVVVWEGGHLYWQNPSGGRTLILGT